MCSPSCACASGAHSLAEVVVVDGTVGSSCVAGVTFWARPELHLDLTDAVVGVAVLAARFDVGVKVSQVRPILSAGKSVGEKILSINTP